jgi:hypothetical protein
MKKINVTKRIVVRKAKGLRGSAPIGSSKGAVKPRSAGGEPAVCPGCRAVLYDKHWHDRALVASWLDLRSAASVKCDACRSGGNHAGEVVLEGLGDSVERDEVIALVRHVGNRATRRDPEDRIVGITVKGSRVRVLTSENQLALSVGKQVHAARKGGELEVTWSDEDKPVRVVWRKVK